MHELSIALSLVDAAEQSAVAAGAQGVRRVNIRVGALSGVVAEALLFAYDVAAEGTLLEGSELVIEEVPVTVYCAGCDAETAVPAPMHLRCPRCDAPTGDIRAGRELEITTLEVEVEDQSPCEHAS